MTGMVVAVSGGLGAGKAALGRALAELAGADRASFGDEVRRHVREAGGDPDDLAALQAAGQALVLHDRAGFVDRVLSARREGVPLVVEGLRHVEVLMEMRDRLGGALRVVHVDAPRAIRQARVSGREGITPREAAARDADVAEEQSDRILPQYASVRVDGTWPVTLQAMRVVDRLGLAARAAGASA